MKRGCSQEEFSLQEFIRYLLPTTEIIFHDRTQIYPYELDIFIPEQKLVIEFNGNFWHSDYRVDINRPSQAAETRHSYKTDICKNKGIKLIHIFEYEWLNLEKQTKIKNYLKDILLQEQKRKILNCNIKKLSPLESKTFFNNNSISEYQEGQYSLGLFNNAELVCCVSFCKKDTSTYEVQLAIKFGIDLDIIEIQKLIQEFRNEHLCSLIAYLDKAKTVNTIFYALGFSEIGVTKPTFFWTKGNDVIFNSEVSSFLKTKADNQNEINEETMRNLGFSKVFNCGYLILELKI